MKQRHSLAHHVRSHECAVGVVVLKERDKRGGDRRNLLRRHVHEVNLVGRHHGEVGVLAALHHLADKCSIVVQRGVALTNDVVFLLLGGKIHDVVVVQVGHAVINLSVGSLDETKLIYLRIDAQRRYKSDVGAFRALDRTQTAIVSVVDVAHLEAGALTRQTARAKGRQTALVCDLGKRVGLVHELRQRVGSEERVDDARYRLGVDQVGRGEHLIVAHVHALADGAAHARKTDGELVAQLLAHRAHATV